MKTRLFFILLIASQVITAQLYINEIFVSPPGTDFPNEYIEIRGVANATIPNGTYIVQIEGDGEASGNGPGDVEADIIDLSGLVLGSNGYLVILDASHPYSVHPDATIVTGLTDGNLEDHSHTFLLIQTSTPPSSSIDIDANNDGEPDGTDYGDWTILDSIAFADDDGLGANDEFAYASLIFAESAIIPTLNYPAGATVISTSTQFDYAARIGESTGSLSTNDETTSDWIAGDIPSGNVPDWVLTSNSTRVIPDSFVASQLNHIGSINPTQNTTLSNPDVLITEFNVYPNPAKDFIIIESNRSEAISIAIYNILGQKILFQDKLSTKRLDVSTLTNGLYLIKISIGEVSITKKIIIKKEL